MEIYAAKDNKFIVFTYEMLGTCMLVFAINMQYGETFGVFGIAFMLFAWLLIGGPITGAHFNPAVTLGVYLSNTKWQEDFTMLLITLFA
jgi:glycerol uptake facilitator-like aquaporin